MKDPENRFEFFAFRIDVIGSRPLTVQNYLRMQGEQRTIPSLAVADDALMGYFIFEELILLGAE